MGLCKCPRRQVTNQFCFEHRCNVCENCMVVVHKKCVVQSYLQWLKDSDYDPNCTLCGENLETSDCIRLTCYHVFHWNCLNDRQSAMPVNTAPGGHTCPICKTGIFPPGNLVSPIADSLRARLNQVGWGRNELALPQFSDSPEFPPSDSIPKKSDEVVKNSTFEGNQEQRQGHLRTNVVTENRPQDSVLNIENYSSSRPLLQQRETVTLDRDENKYKRKSPQEIFNRWSRRLYSPAARPPWRRTWFIVSMGFSIFFLVIYLMYVFGRTGSDGQKPDPNLHYD